mgnify:CR=1 FL=1
MPSQEEVLKAINKLGGVATLKELKEHFGISHFCGSSVLPQRLKSLEKQGLIGRYKCKHFKFVVYVALDEDLSILRRETRVKQLKLNRGYRRESESLTQAIFSEVRKCKAVTAHNIASRVGVDKNTAKQHLEKLVEQGLIFKFEDNGFTFYSPLYVFQ